MSGSAELCEKILNDAQDKIGASSIELVREGVVRTILN